jgi:hypothetical protein
METASVRVQTPAKREVRALVPAEDFPCTIIINFKLDLTGSLEEFAILGLERIGGVGNGPHARILIPIRPACQAIPLPQSTWMSRIDAYNNEPDH